MRDRDRPGVIPPGGARKPSKILLDFEGVPFAPYAHFEGKLVFLQKKFERDGGLMKMANLHPSVRQQFHVNRLDKYFALDESVEDALRAFPGDEADHAT